MITISGLPQACDVCGKPATNFLHLQYPAEVKKAGCDDHPVACLRVA